MVKNPTRALSWGIPVARRLCTESSLSAAGGTTERKPLYRRLSALGSGPDGRAAETMNQWLREGRAVSAPAIINYVKQLRKYKRYNHALELMDWMEMRGMKMSNASHAIRLDLISKVKGLDTAEKYFSSLTESSKNQLTYGALLSCYCKEKMADKAIALYEKMKELNLASSTLVYNNLMSLYMKLDQPEKVPPLLQEMKANSLRPDNFAYCILINSYASVNDMESVERVVQEMEEGGEVTLEWSTYSTLAAHYNSAGQFKKAESALKKLEEIMGKDGPTPFQFLISLYAAAGNLAEVGRVWKSLKATFPKTTNRSYLIMLQALDKLDDMDALKQCFEEWESVYVSFDIRLVNTMIGSYLRKDMVKEAESLWEKATKKGIGYDSRTLELLIGHYLKNHEMDLVLKCLEVATSMVKQDNWKVSKEVVNMLQKLCKEVNDVDRANEFCKSLKKLNCLDSETYESLLHTCQSAGKT